jgi:hypothetical protein
MTKKLALLLLFAIAFTSSFFGFLGIWSKAMVCADIGHSCRLSAINNWLFALVSFPVSSLPDDLLVHVFGSDSLLPMFVFNATAWGIVAVVATLLVLRLKKRRVD